MVPPAKPGRADKPDSMVADARAESLAELGPDEQHRAFYRLSVPKKLIVMAGGILTNLALGVILLALALGVVGQRPNPSPDPRSNGSSSPGRGRPATPSTPEWTASRSTAPTAT